MVFKKTSSTDFHQDFVSVSNVAMMNASHTAFVTLSTSLSVTLSMSTSQLAPHEGKTSINQALSAAGPITLEGL